MGTSFRRLLRLSTEAPRLLRCFSTSFGARNRGDSGNLPRTPRFEPANASEVGPSPTPRSEIQAAGLVSESGRALSTYSSEQQNVAGSIERPRRPEFSVQCFRFRLHGILSSTETAETYSSAPKTIDPGGQVDFDISSEFEVHRIRKAGADGHRLPVFQCSACRTTRAVARSGSHVFGDRSFLASSVQRCSPHSSGVPTRCPPTVSISRGLS